MLSHAKLHQAKIMGQIQGSYSNIEKSLITIGIDDFLKCVETGIIFYEGKVVEGYIAEKLSGVEKSEGEGKDTLVKGLAEEIASFEKMTVVPNSNSPLTVYVDTLSKSGYKDNELNRFLKREVIKSEEFVKNEEEGNQ